MKAIKTPALTGISAILHCLWDSTPSRALTSESTSRAPRTFKTSTDLIRPFVSLRIRVSSVWFSLLLLCCSSNLALADQAQADQPGADQGKAGLESLLKSEVTPEPKLEQIAIPPQRIAVNGPLEVPLRGPLTQPVSLENAMNETLLQSPRASSLRLQLAIAKSNLVRATQLPNPNIFMDNGYRAEFTYRYGFAVPIEPPWKLALRILAAKKAITLADLEIAKGLWSLRGAVRRAYTQVLVGQERYEALADLASLYQRLQNTAEKRAKAGDVARLDVFRAELANTQATINRDQMATQVLQAKQSLNVLLGRRHELEIVVPRLEMGTLKAQVTKVDLLPDWEKPLPSSSELVAKAREHRLEIKIVDQAIKTNHANLKVAYGNILPTPAIGVGSSTVNGPPQTAGSNSKNNFHGFFFQTFAELPVFNFQQGDISKYRATIAQLEAERKTQANIIEAEVVQAYQAVVMQRQKIQAYEAKALAKSKEIARLTQRSYEVGESDITSALVAQQANVQVRNEYLDAIQAYELAYTDLEQAVGSTLY